MNYTLTFRQCIQGLVILILGSLFLLPQISESKNQDGGPWVSDDSAPLGLAYFWNCSGTGCGAGASGWDYGLSAPIVSVTYQANVYNNDTNEALTDGATIPVGTVLRFTPKPYEGQDIVWFGSGSTNDSPNGHWIAGAAAPAFACDAYDQSGSNLSDSAGTGNKYNTYSPLSLNPPNNNLDVGGSSAVLTNVGPNLYRVDGPGTINARFTFDATNGEFYYRYLMTFKSYSNLDANRCYGNQTPMEKITALPPPVCFFNCTGVYGIEDYQVNVPPQTITFNLTASAGAATGTGTCSDGIRNGDESGIDSGGRCGNIDNSCYSRWDCYDTQLNEGPNAGTTYGLCVPEGEAPPTQYPSCFNSTYTAEDRNKVTTDTIPPGYTACAAVCPAAPPSCTDGIQNQDETGVDTGGVCAAANQPPANPTLTGPDTTVNTPVTFNISGDDPDGTSIRYVISDAACVVSNQLVPGDGSLVADTSTQTFNRTPTSVGQYTVYAYAVDAGGVRSAGCGQATITVNSAPAAAAVLKINNSDGPIDVPRNTTATLSWTSQNAASCTMFGEGMGPTGTSVPLNSTGMAVTITQTGNFAVSCDTASDQVTANVVNRAPEQPTIMHDTGSAPFNTPTTFRIQGNDPDGDSVFYEVDFNTDDGDGFNTTTGGGPNNSIQTTNRAFTTSGPQTIRARTVDVPHGLRSTWGTYTINIDNAPAPIATLSASINNGPFQSGDQTINPGDSVTMQWGSQNAATCTGTGPGFDTSNSPSGQDGVTAPNPNTNTTFEAMCTGGGGQDGATITITTRQLPNFNQPLVTISSLGTFDPATATYSYVDIYFSTANDGGSDTRSSAPYSVELTGRPTQTGNIPSGLTPGPAGFNATVRIPGPITLGSAPVKVSIDTPIATGGSVAEVTEGEADNTNTATLAVPPPDPGLTLTSDRGRVRLEETTTLRFRTTISWSQLSCRLTGPGINEAVPISGTRNTLPIFAKSEYVFSCVDGITNTKWSKTVSVETTGTIEEI